MNERPQLDLPSSASSCGTWLILLAWIISAISLLLLGLSWLSMGMSAGATHLTVEDAVAIHTWPALLGTSIVLFFKRYEPTKARANAILLPVVFCVPSLPFYMVTFGKHPLVVILVWAVPAAALVLEEYFRVRDKTVHLLEAALALMIAAIPVRMLVAGIDFNAPEPPTAEEAAAYRTRLRREAYFASLSGLLKRAVPDNLGRWRMVVVMAPGDRLDDLTLYEQLIHGPMEKGPLTNGIWVLYEEIGLDSEEQQGNRAERLTELINAYKREYESLGSEMRDRRNYLRNAIEALPKRYGWGEDRWNEHEKSQRRLMVRVELNLPNDKIYSQGVTWTELATIDRASLFVLPWTSLGAMEHVDLAFRKSCLLGESNQSEQMESKIMDRTYCQEPFMLKSLGVNITVTASNANKVDEFVKMLDLAPFKEITRRTPPRDLDGGRL